MPIPLGVLAVAGAGAAGAAGAFDHIQTINVTSNQVAVSFDLNGLSATYEHLQMRFVVKSSGSGVASNLSLYNIAANNDAGTAKQAHFLQGDGSSVTSSNNTQFQRPYIGRIHSDSYVAGIVDLLDPFNLNKNLVARALFGARQDISLIQLRSAYMPVTNIADIGLYCENDRFIAPNSRVSLYGLRSA